MTPLPHCALCILRGRHGGLCLNAKLNHMKLSMFGFRELSKWQFHMAQSNTRNQIDFGWPCSLGSVSSWEPGLSNNSNTLLPEDLDQEIEKREKGPWQLSFSQGTRPGLSVWIRKASPSLIFGGPKARAPVVVDPLQRTILTSPPSPLHSSDTQCPNPRIASSTLKFFLPSSLEVLEVSRVSWTVRTSCETKRKYSPVEKFPRGNRKLPYPTFS